jgi:hypothetical protein
VPRAWGRDPTALGNRVSKAHSEDVFDQMGQNDGTRMCLTRWGRTMTTKVVKTRFFSEPKLRGRPISFWLGIALKSASWWQRCFLLVATRSLPTLLQEEADSFPFPRL